MPLVLTAALLSGCTGDSDEPDSGPTPAPSAGASDAPEVVTTVKVGTVTGRLPAAKRKNAADQVGDVVDRWYDAAYLGGDRSTGAWPGFTKGAAAEARHDQDLTSETGSQDGPVTPGLKAVRVDLLAVRQKPAGATAHVFLRYPVGDHAVKITGRLFLSPSKQGWQVFGYDLARGNV
ncbi:hypothetical protein [Nocardioides mangrovi]|uniref:Lipoprotein n=1 Tax=Nocardioides mangrovi TaxID=2874580 RepID=A0ABS7U702_9ACTN|nr:hypothetical protein [Nocardioides mangrovi]MBZ5736536.1 hypothetical protein [Nocardioides mangrovi]